MKIDHEGCPIYRLGQAIEESAPEDLKGVLKIMILGMCCIIADEDFQQEFVKKLAEATNGSVAAQFLLKYVKQAPCSPLEVDFVEVDLEDSDEETLEDMQTQGSC